MKQSFFYQFVITILVLASNIYSEENFLMINGLSNEIILETGPNVHTQFSPACTFNITLSLMGYDSRILTNEESPKWDFQEGYDNYLESWQAPQTPSTWMKYSVVWFSKLLKSQLGHENFKQYLCLFDYGNQDCSDKNACWLSSSLKISLKEQVAFVQKMVLGKLPVSPHALLMTRNILFKEELPQGWRLFGKTGLGRIYDQDGSNRQVGWFVGWVENDDVFLPFAFHMCQNSVNIDQRNLRVKQILIENLPH